MTSKTATINNALNFKNRLIDKFISSIVTAFYLFGFNYKSFIERLRVELVKEGLRRKMSMSDISVRCGIDKRKVSSIKHGKANYTDTSPGITFDVLDKLNNYQQVVNNGKPIFLTHFNKIVNDNKDGNVITSPELYLKLICSDAYGCAERTKNHVNILSPCLNKTTNLDVLLGLYSNNSNHYINTVKYNIKTTKENKLFERMVSSTQIPLDKQDKVKKRINYILLKSLKLIRRYIDSHETEVERGTYPVIGTHMYQFFQQHEVNHEKGSSSSSIVSFNKRVHSI